MDCGFEFFAPMGTPAGLPASSSCAGLPASAARAGAASIAIGGGDFAPAAGPRARLAQARRAAQVRDYVAAHVDDPEVNARDCARSLGMSLRSLHLALAGQAVTFNGLVQQARLDRCQALLLSPDAADNVADLAFACGFNSLSSFYRAFRRHFGVCPGTLRASLA